MAVNFTANIGLAKPTEAELAENWANNTKLQEDNNLIIIDKTDITLTTYTPTVIATTTAPSVGAGVIKGEYQDIEGYIAGHFILDFLDPGVAAGTGEYGIKLPFPADSSYHWVGTALTDTPGSLSVIGEGYANDSSNFNTSGTVALDIVTVAGISYARLITEAHTGKTSRIFRDAQPFTVGTGDKIAGNFFYRKA